MKVLFFTFLFVNIIDCKFIFFLKQLWFIFTSYTEMFSVLLLCKGDQKKKVTSQSLWQ